MLTAYACVCGIQMHRTTVRVILSAHLRAMGMSCPRVCKAAPTQVQAKHCLVLSCFSTSPFCTPCRSVLVVLQDNHACLCASQRRLFQDKRPSCHDPHHTSTYQHHHNTADNPAWQWLEAEPSGSDLCCDLWIPHVQHQVTECTAACFAVCLCQRTGWRCQLLEHYHIVDSRPFGQPKHQCLCCCGLDVIMHDIVFASWAVLLWQQ